MANNHPAKLGFQKLGENIAETSKPETICNDVDSNSEAPKSDQTATNNGKASGNYERPSSSKLPTESSVAATSNQNGKFKVYHKKVRDRSHVYPKSRQFLDDQLLDTEKNTTETRPSADSNLDEVDSPIPESTTEETRTSADSNPEEVDSQVPENTTHDTKTSAYSNPEEIDATERYSFGSSVSDINQSAFKDDLSRSVSFLSVEARSLEDGDFSVGGLEDDKCSNSGNTEDLDTSLSRNPASTSVTAPIDIRNKENDGPETESQDRAGALKHITVPQIHQEQFWYDIKADEVMKQQSDPSRIKILNREFEGFAGMKKKLQQRLQRKYFSGLDGKNKGYALLINFTFINSESERLGSVKGMRSMKSLWEKLGFECTEVTDETTDDNGIAFDVKKFCQTHTGGAMYVVVISTHGLHKALMNPNGKLTKRDDVLRVMAALIEKTSPKLVVFDACSQKDDKSEKEYNPKPDQCTQAETTENLINFYRIGAVPDCVSVRMCEFGSYLTHAIIYVFKFWACEEDLASMLCRVCRLVNEWAADLLREEELTNKDPKMEFKLLARSQMNFKASTGQFLYFFPLYTPPDTNTSSADGPNIMRDKSGKQSLVSKLPVKGIYKSPSFHEESEQLVCVDPAKSADVAQRKRRATREIKELMNDSGTDYRNMLKKVISCCEKHLK